MIIKNFKKCMALVITATSVIAFNPVGVSALSEHKIIVVTNSTGDGKLTGNTFASSVTVGYIKCNGVDLVKITELAENIGEKIIKKGNELEVYLNGKKVTIDAGTGCVYIDGAQVYDKLVNGNYIVPKDVVQNKLGIICCENGIRIHRERVGGVVQVESVDSTYGYNHTPISTGEIAANTSSGSSTFNSNGASTVNSDGSVTTINADGSRTTTGNDYSTGTIAYDSSTQSSSSTADGYIPVYDYDVRDYIDAYVDKQNLSRMEYNQNIVNTATALMNKERQANINEGWHTKAGKFYFLKKGAPVIGWHKDGLIWYYFNTDGSMHTGWLKDGGNWYYFHDSGAMAQKVLVNSYYLNEQGAWSNNVPANAPTGITYKELINRVRNLGYSHKTCYSANDEYNVSKSDTCSFRWYSPNAADYISYLDIRDNYTVSLSARYETTNRKYNNAGYEILKWLLPNQIDEVYSKINSNPGKKQTIYADGRIVDVSFFQGGINFDIKDQ